MSRYLIVVLILIFAKPIFSQEAKLVLVDSLAFGPLFEFDSRVFTHCTRPNEDLIFEISPNGDISEIPNFEMQKWGGLDTSFLHTQWKTKGNHVYSFGNYSILDSNWNILSWSPYFHKYDQDFQRVEKYSFLDSINLGSELTFFTDTNSVVFFGYKWIIGTNSFPEISEDSLYLLEVDLSNFDFRLKSFEMPDGFVPSSPVSMPIKEMLLSSDHSKIILKTEFGIANYVAYQLDLSSYEIKALDQKFSEVSVGSPPVIPYTIATNEEPSEKQFLYVSDKPIRTGDLGDINPSKKQAFLYYLNVDLEIIQYSILEDLEYYYDKSQFHKGRLVKRFFNDTISGFSTTDWAQDSVSPYTAEIYKDGFFYFKKNLKTGETLDRRFITRFDALKDYNNHLTMNHAAEGDVVFPDTVAMLLYTNPPGPTTLRERGLMSIPLSSMPQALKELSSKELSFSVFPNPSVDQVRIIGSKKGSFQIFSQSGQEMMQGQYFEGIPIDLNRLNHGNYIIKIKDGSSFGSFKLIRE